MMPGTYLATMGIDGDLGGGEGGAEGRAELPARVDVRGGRLAEDRHRLLRLAPAEAGRDLLDGQQRAVRVVVAVHPDAERSTARRLEARVVDLVEEVLER